MLLENRVTFKGNIISKMAVTKKLQALAVKGRQKFVSLRLKRNETLKAWRYYLDLRGIGGKYDFSSPLFFYDDPSREKESNLNFEKAKIWRDAVVKDYLNGKTGYNSNGKESILFLPYFMAMAIGKRDPEHKLTEGTSGTWMSAYNLLAAYCNDKTTLVDAAKPEFAENFKQYLDKYRRHIKKSDRKAPLANNTKWLYFQKLCVCLKKAYDDKLIADNPLRGVKNYTREETPIVYLTSEELERVAKIPCKYPVIKRAFFFSCYCGLRLSDVIKLRWDQIKEYKDHNNDTRCQMRLKQEKTKNWIELPISQMAVSCLGKRGDRGDLIFNGLPSKPTIERYIARMCNDAGIEDHITFHKSRHTFGTQEINSDVPLYDVANLMGHKNSAMTERYAHIMKRKLQTDVDRLPSIDVNFND